MRSLELGKVEITRLAELETAEFAPLRESFPDHDPAVLRDNESWLAPRYVNPETGFWKACVQTDVVRSAGKIILVDTGLGNHKERPYFVAGTHLDTDYLDRLAALGVTPSDVDVVVATHLHVDHVG